MNGMDVTVTNAHDRKRYEARVGGQGVASALVRGALDDVRAQQREVLAVCPFVSGYIGRHLSEYGDLLYQSRTGAVPD